jgi:hypothetical protein
MCSLLSCRESGWRAAGRFRCLFVAAAVLLWGVVSSGPAQANTLTFQNVTFSTDDLGGGVLRLTIDNALNATTDWDGIQSLAAFGLKIPGTWTSASLTAFTFSTTELNANGCFNGNPQDTACFTASPAPLALSNHMVFDISFSGGTADFSLPHLKVLFLDGDGNKKGSLLSEDIPAVPGPIVGAGLPGLLLACSGLLLLARRRRRLNALPA